MKTSSLMVPMRTFNASAFAAGSSKTMLSRSSLFNSPMTSIATRSYTNEKGAPFFGHSQFKKQSPEFHRNSTLYAVSPRETLTKLEQTFVMPERHVPKSVSDYFARYAVLCLRKLSNLFFKEKYIHYACVLETVAAVPGMVAGMLNHLKVLRNMEHNNWIKILLDEAENERMHLMTFMEISMPTKIERWSIAAVQAAYWNVFLVFYVIAPSTAHRFTGYLEEEAVITYTNMLKDLDAGKIENCQAPDIAVHYWGLPENATLRDVVIVIRQDEVDHGHVNHVHDESPILMKHDEQGPINIDVKAVKKDIEEHPNKHI
eukprot:gene15235-18031_t